MLANEAGKQLDGDAVAAFRGYYRGRRTVAWSAFFAAAPQRFLAWLGGASPAIGAGVTGSAALLLGLGTPQAPVSSPAIPSPALVQPVALANASDGPAAPRRTSLVSDDRTARRNPGGRRDRDRRARRPGNGTPVAALPPAADAPPSGGGSTPGGGSAPGGGSGGGGGGGGGNLPQVKLPDVKVPEVRVPEVRTPQITVPEVKVPKVPGVDLPEIKTPPITVPEIKTPEIKVPAVDLPDVQLPQLP